MITQGLNTFGGLVSQGLSAQYQIVLVLDYVVTKHYYWYIAEYGEAVQAEPHSAVEAERLARTLSRTNKSGLMEVYRYINGKPVCVSIYLRGKKQYQGRKAQQAVKYKLPPTL